MVGGAPIDVAPGQSLCIPRGAVHRFDNHGSEDVKPLCVISPGVLGPEYFREMGGLWPPRLAVHPTGQR